MKNKQMPHFTKDERTIIMLYNPGSRAGLIRELKQMQKLLTKRDENLKRWTRSVLDKIQKMSDQEFDQLELF